MCDGPRPRGTYAKFSALVDEAAKRPQGVWVMKVKLTGSEVLEAIMYEVSEDPPARVIEVDLTRLDIHGRPNGLENPQFERVDGSHAPLEYRYTKRYPGQPPSHGAKATGAFQRRGGGRTVRGVRPGRQLPGPTPR